MRKIVSDNGHLLLVGIPFFLLTYCSAFTGGYGYFIDEFYYIACAYHPAFGYVDHPPIAPLVLTLFQFVFGNSIYAIRILPALAQSSAVVLTGVLTREIGGGRFAQFLSACSMAAAPMVVAFGGFYSMNAFEPMLAVLLMYYTARMIKEENAKKWIPIGILMGVGIMNKHTFALFIIALVLSIIISGKWRLMLNKWFLIGSLCGLILVIPNIVWQVLNGYPSLEFYRNIGTGKNVYTPPLAFVAGQIIGMSPVNFIIWIAGAAYILAVKRMKDYRFLPVLFFILFFFMMLMGVSRGDRMIFVYPAVFAGGGIFFENLAGKYNLHWLKGVIIALLVSWLIVVLPVVLPYYDYETVRTRMNSLGMNTEIERGNKPPLPQLIADRIGWEERYDLVLNAYRSLKPEERKETVIAAGNYGQAGAIELFGKNDTIAPVVCAHNNYYLWSRERLKANIVLMVVHPRDTTYLKRNFGSVEPCTGEYCNPYVSAHENNLKVFKCRQPRISYKEMLDRGKIYH